MRIALALVLLVAGCTAPAPRPSPGRSPTPSASGDGTPLIDCLAVIDRPTEMPPSMEVFLDAVQLPTKVVLQTTPASESGQLFAKWGLVVRAGTTVDLRVSGEDLGHAMIGWSGAPSKPQTDLRAQCTGEGWMAFAGGYWVDSPRCVTLIIRARNEQTTAHLAIGAPCG
jgi:hypothetical protein